ncbi:exosome subunit Rrp43 [Schizosaccharomyces japonicus yFS275]|uniref:Ribosomal RNA-processing protein 43 n=1 Tax=Schizosaccharomyces japonicus (strain yFS275 / FY16936) TaxID=402676 RepID=B6K5V8_SCHJY|nr:exosome subunit Rrp43 [Schizosaccharomyces japonicus yFS275]EEB08912.1 exosome subunit Rrp43 [Schizosaccharomyces japonicus yFS275]
MSDVKPLSFPPSIYKSIAPGQYLQHFLDNQVRPDGRTVSEFRPRVVNTQCISTADGSCIVRAGESVFVCGIKAEIAEPELEAPSRGWIVPNVEMGPLCNGKFKPGPPRELAQVVSEQMNQVLEQTCLVPLESLCIREKKAAWCLYADIVCLNYDGNAFDCAWKALMHALETTRLPAVVWDEDEERVVCVHDERAKHPLALSSHIESFSWTVFGNCVLADPTDDEESLCVERLTIMLDNAGRICKLVKMGGTHIQKGLLKGCLQIAKEHVLSLTA